MSNQRPIQGRSRGTTQQSLAVDSRDYQHFRVSTTYVGVILSVYYADDLHTLSAQRDPSHRGTSAECSVLCVATNSGTPLKLDHVRIPPTQPSGLADFSEQLPRGSSAVIDGSVFDESFSTVDPHTLDGDWCVVSFIGGNLDLPYVSNWWNHPRNNLDPATSGLGNPDESGTPKALDQSGRVFRRVKGVEHICTDVGDIYLSTEFANSRLNFTQTAAPNRGSWNRTTNSEVGGSVQVRIKSSQTVELDWNPSVEGVGINGGAETNLPQTNPPGPQQAPATPTYTTLFISKDDIVINVPTKVAITSSKSLTLKSEDTASVSGKNLLELDGTQVKVGSGADQPMIRGEDLLQWLSNLSVLTATGPAKISSADIASFINPLTGSSVKSTKTVVE